ncbi:hypothetical protein FRC03_005510 [Tulasnella sp. 419]|nr:hypothetical protein FRC03_005510 [Tulasnella sp. 419]
MVNDRMAPINGSGGDTKPTSKGDAVLDFLQASGTYQPKNTPSTTSTSPDGNTSTQDVGGGEEEYDDSEVAELLKQLEEADELASGLDSKLDGILSNLDRILSGLAPDEDGQAEGDPRKSSSKKD